MIERSKGMKVYIDEDRKKRDAKEVRELVSIK